MGKIKVFEKNKLDLSYTAATITVTDAVATDAGNDYVDYVRDRSNYTGHGTTGSTDAANTRYDADTVDQHQIDTLILANMNFLAYTIQYHNGSAYTDFNPAINVSANTKRTKLHQFDEVTANLFRMIITGTMTANDDKSLSQWILTKEVGTFNAQPNIEKVLFNEDKKITKMLSSRAHIARKSAGLGVKLTFPPNKHPGDLLLIADLYSTLEGRLISLAGFDELEANVTGFRTQDFYLMAAENNFDTKFHMGRFANGQVNQVDLVEVA